MIQVLTQGCVEKQQRTFVRENFWRSWSTLRAWWRCHATRVNRTNMQTRSLSRVLKVTWARKRSRRVTTLRVVVLSFCVGSPHQTPEPLSSGTSVFREPLSPKTCSGTKRRAPRRIIASQAHSASPMFLSLVCCQRITTHNTSAEPSGQQDRSSECPPDSLS